MKSIDAKKQIADGGDVSKIKSRYIQDKVDSVNYKNVGYEDVRKDTELPHIIAKADLDFRYYVLGEISKGEFDKLSAEEDDKMSIAVYNENEKRGNPYPRLKEAMEFVGDDKGLSIIDEIRSRQKIIQ